VGIPCGHRETCPVAALQAYLTHAGIQSGAVFRATNHHGPCSAGSAIGP
jgi:hypothetical protein